MIILQDSKDKEGCEGCDWNRKDSELTGLGELPRRTISSMFIFSLLSQFYPFIVLSSRPALDLLLFYLLSFSKDDLTSWTYEQAKAKYFECIEYLKGPHQTKHLAMVHSNLSLVAFKQNKLWNVDKLYLIYLSYLSFMIAKYVKIFYDWSRCITAKNLLRKAKPLSKRDKVNRAAIEDNHGRLYLLSLCLIPSPSSPSILLVLLDRYLRMAFVDSNPQLEENLLTPPPKSPPPELKPHAPEDTKAAKKPPAPRAKAPQEPALPPTPSPSPKSQPPLSPLSPTPTSTDYRSKARVNFEKAFKVRKKQCGDDHHLTAFSLDHLAQVQQKSNDIKEKDEAGMKYPISPLLYSFPALFD